MGKKDEVNRGDVFVVNFDPSVGSEIQKSRPALVLQNNIANRHSAVTVVAAITSYDNENQVYPTEVHISAPEGGLVKDSLVLLNQIRTIDKQRLVKKLGVIDEKTLAEVSSAIEISLGLVEV